MSPILVKSIKSGLSVSIALIIGESLGINSLFYAGIAAAIATQVQVKHTLIIGLGRIFSTFLGAIFGAIVYSFLPNNPIVMGLFIFIIVYICQRFIKLSQSNIACIVFLGILVNLDPGESPDFYVIHRILDTAVGVFSSILVSLIPFSICEEK